MVINKGKIIATKIKDQFENEHTVCLNCYDGEDWPEDRRSLMTVEHLSLSEHELLYCDRCNQLIADGDPG